MAREEKKKNVSKMWPKTFPPILTERRFRPGDKLPNERDFARGTWGEPYFHPGGA